MKYLFIFLIISIFSVGHAEVNLDEILTDMMEDYHLPGLAAMIIKEGEIIWQQNYGFADIEDNTLVDNSTTFMVASISKTFVGTALMKLWELNMFDLDDPINDYLDFEVINPNYPDKDITFRMLMTHSSSIKGDFHDDGILMPNFTWGVDHPMTLEEFLPEHFVPGGDYYAETNYNNYEPGTQFDYSSVATSLAAHLVESITGSTFEAFCRDYIFDPLNMDNTSWFLANMDTETLASHYTYQNGEYVKWQPRGTVIYPCGWLKTSIHHLKNYLMTFMADGVYENSVYLNSATIDSMLTVQYPEMGTQFTGSKWGLFWYRLIYGGRTLWGHEGGSLGVTTLMYFDPVTEIGVIMLSNGTDPSCMKNKSRYMFQYAEEYGTNADDCNNYSPITELQTYPNPLKMNGNRSEVSIDFSLEEDLELEVNVYNLKGELVKEIISGNFKSGNHQLSWNGTNRSDKITNSGIYFIRIDGDGFQKSKKIIKLK